MKLKHNTFAVSHCKRKGTKLRRLPLYAIVKRLGNGTILGFVEHSFSMGWSETRVNIQPGPWKPEYKKFFDDTLRRNSGSFLVKLGTKKCPIKVDMNWYALYELDKFDFRNAQFTVK